MTSKLVWMHRAIDCTPRGWVSLNLHEQETTASTTWNQLSLRDNIGAEDVSTRQRHCHCWRHRASRRWKPLSHPPKSERDTSSLAKTNAAGFPQTRTNLSDLGRKSLALKQGNGTKDSKSLLHHTGSLHREDRPPRKSNSGATTVGKMQLISHALQNTPTRRGELSPSPGQ